MLKPCMVGGGWWCGRGYGGVVDWCVVGRVFGSLWYIVVVCVWQSCAERRVDYGC